MKLILRSMLFLSVILQIIILSGFPVLVLAADPVSGARLITPADRREGYVSYMKTQAPQLKVSFNKLAFKNGEELTAQAIASGFKDDADQLYYTWYLKREGCDLKSNKEGCDEDGDGKVTVNDWKIKATKIYAKGNFERQDADYGAASGDDDGYEVMPSLNDWEMPYKSKNEVDVENCYIQDFKRGRFYELRETKPVFDCSNGGSIACGKDQQINCGAGSQSICASTDDYKCRVDSDAEIENFRAGVKCPATEGIPESQQKKPVCGEPEDTLFNFDNSTSGNLNICNKLTEDPNRAGTCSVGLILNNDDGTRSGSTPSCTFKKSNNLCKHLFPTQKAPSKLDDNGIKTGDDEFTAQEEEFWGTDPKNSSTKGNGLTDEANIAGLGAKSFTWTYKDGDQIGLVVEGTSAISTKHDDNSYMRTWVFSKNKCEELSDNINKFEKDLRAFYIEYQEVPQVNAGFLTTIFDLNDCLEENLIDPTGGGIGNLDVSVTATPEKPNNDSAGTGRGDLVRAQAIVNGADDISSLYYDWTVEISPTGSDLPEDDGWIDVTKNIKGLGVMRGIGISEVEIPMNIPTDAFADTKDKTQYIRLKAKVSENDGTSQNRAGRGIFLLRVTQLDEGITPYLIQASSEGKVSLDKTALICNEDSELSDCPVIENSIIGLTVPNDDKKLTNFSWRLDGKVLTCSQDISSDCASGDDSTVFFPAAGSPGESFEATLSVKDTETGLVRNMSRKFTIVEPSMRIVSANEELVWPRQLGVYKDVDGNETPDYSDMVLETNTGNAVDLEASFTPSWIKDRANYTWTVNGEEQAEFENSNMVFNVEQEEGSTYNILSEATYAMASSDEQTANTRKALSNIWGVSYDNSTEKNINASIEVEVVAAYDEVAKASGKNGIFASMVSNIPGELMFLLRLALTGVVLVVVTGVVFAVTPEFGEKRGR
jgi:hypothetical protein